MRVPIERMIMKSLVKLPIIIFTFILISTTCLHAGSSGEITYTDNGMIRIENLSDSTPFEMGEKIEVSYMAGILEMLIGKYEVIFSSENMVHCKELFLSIPPDKGMTILISRTSQMIEIDEPDPGAMLPPSEDPRFLPENSGGSGIVQGLRYNADLVEGEVIEIMGKDVRIQLTTSGVVRVGYVADLVFQTLSGSELPVGKWSIIHINNREVVASPLEKTMTPCVGLKAKIMPPKKEDIKKPEIVAIPPKETKKENTPVSIKDKKEINLEKRAQQGNPKAQNKLGMNYQKGRGVGQSYAKAYFWYKKAADQNDADGQNNVGWFYEKGFGMSKDLNQAALWYQKAAEQEFATAQNNLGRSYQHGLGVPQDYQKAVYWYKKAADQGHLYGQSNMGWMYQNGLGVEKDLSQAASWYKKSADQGSGAAQNNLGSMYKNGDGVKKDINQAIYWYLKAAEQGNTRAQNNLGTLYINGDGVPRDREKAISWFKKAAKNGNKAAKNNLKKLGESR